MVVSSMGAMGALESATSRRTRKGAESEGSVAAGVFSMPVVVATMRNGARMPAMRPVAKVMYP